MKKLLNTLYVLTPESYLYVRNGAIAVKVGGEERCSVPAQTIDSVVCFGVNTVSTPFLGFCAEQGITVSFISGTGRFLARVCGPVSGNVLLRKAQYKSLEDAAFSTRLVRDILYAKIRNSKEVLLRSGRSQNNEKVKARLSEAAAILSGMAKQLSDTGDIGTMRGIEGAAANAYFSCFDTMLYASAFKFDIRSRRPPKNEVNAALSFVYMLLTREIQSALESVGIDPAAGYLHTLRPGRPSFALDLIEELRAPLCDRFVISLFNKGQLQNKDFERDYDAVYLNDKGRRTVLQAWQKRKNETIQHPFLEEKLEIGMIPYAQAMLFARVLRGDLDEYPPFVWR